MSGGRADHYSVERIEVLAAYVESQGRFIEELVMAGDYNSAAARLFQLGTHIDELQRRLKV
jgi:hypothetical protein